jgi:hypothetical protein
VDFGDVNTYCNFHRKESEGRGGKGEKFAKGGWSPKKNSKGSGEAFTKEKTGSVGKKDSPKRKYSGIRKGGVVKKSPIKKASVAKSSLKSPAESPVKSPTKSTLRSPLKSPQKSPKKIVIKEE